MCAHAVHACATKSGPHARVAVLVGARSAVGMAGEPSDLRDRVANLHCQVKGKADEADCRDSREAHEEEQEAIEQVRINPRGD